MTYKTELFISYASSDKPMMEMLSKHLNALVVSGHLDTWTDKSLEPGELWEPEIKRKLVSADIILLLISAQYWSAPYAPAEEMSLAIQRAGQGLTTIVPIIIEPCFWKSSPIACYNVLPANGIPVSLSGNIDLSFSEIAEKIYELAQAIKERKSKEITQQKTLLEHERQCEDILPTIEKSQLPAVRLVKAFIHPLRVLDAAFNRNRTKFATVCDDGCVRIFNTYNNELESVIRTKPESLLCVSWSFTGREIATGGVDGNVRIWRDRAQVRELEGDGSSVFSVEYSSDGEKMVTASQNGMVALWHPRNGMIKWRKKVHDSEVNSVRFDALGKNIVTASTDNTSAVLNTATGDVISRFEQHNDKACISLFVSSGVNQRNTCLSAGHDGRLLLWDYQNSDNFAEVCRHNFWVRTLSVGGGGNFVVSGGYDASLKFIDLDCGDIFESFSVDRGPIYCVRLSSDSQALLVSSEDHYVYLFSLS